MTEALPDLGPIIDENNRLLAELSACGVEVQPGLVLQGAVLECLIESLYPSDTPERARFDIGVHLLVTENLKLIRGNVSPLIVPTTSTIVHDGASS
jgi:hypothetical protein